MPTAFKLLILLPAFVCCDHYKGWTGPPTTRPKNHIQTDTPPIVLSDTTDVWTSIAVSDLMKRDDPVYDETTLNYINDGSSVEDFAEKLASDYFLGKEPRKDDYRGMRLTTDSGSRQESYEYETESGSKTSVWLECHSEPNSSVIILFI